MRRGVAAAASADAVPHLLGGLVRERDGEHLVGARQALLDGVRDAVRDDARLAGAGAGEDEHRAVGVHDGLALFGVERREQIHSCGNPVVTRGPAGGRGVAGPAAREWRRRQPPRGTHAGVRQAARRVGNVSILP